MLECRSAAALVSVPTLVQQTSKLAGEARLVCSTAVTVSGALLSGWLLAAHERRQLLRHCKGPQQAVIKTSHMARPWLSSMIWETCIAFGHGLPLPNVPPDAGVPLVWPAVGCP